MHGATKALLKSTSVIALLSGCLLLPSPASAQFNFPGIQFRVPYMGGGGGHYRTRHHKVHERRSKGDPDESEPAERNKSTPQPLSAPMKDTPPPAGGGSPAPGKPAGGEEPTFSPSR